MRGIDSLYRLSGTCHLEMLLVYTRKITPLVVEAKK